MHDILGKQMLICQIPSLCNYTKPCNRPRAPSLSSKTSLQRGSRILSISNYPDVRATRTLHRDYPGLGLPNCVQWGSGAKETGPVFTYWYGKGNVANVNDW